MMTWTRLIAEVLGIAVDVAEVLLTRVETPEERAERHRRRKTAADARLDALRPTAGELADELRADPMAEAWSGIRRPHGGPSTVRNVDGAMVPDAE